ncbi:DNA cytosine methyltransferase [Longimicrobium sp.]|uniref:DNA cytosine methyltransferase n=1 Tax=Longimicrobium sp. TaxID=2029185 RepID=UPI0032C22EB3
MEDSPLSSIEICAGAGGQALGLERAGFRHEITIEIDDAACATLQRNRPEWNVVKMDVRDFHAREYREIDLLAGGVPCPPFSIAGKQLGPGDERDLFPAALRLVEEARPRAVMLENVRGLSTARFKRYREDILSRLRNLGYDAQWQVLNACNYSVPQLRPRFILVALRGDAAARFRWPRPIETPPTVGEALRELMGSRGWPGAAHWAAKANSIAPTLVGGSKKHGGPDLGPTRAKLAWRELGVDGHGVADLPPACEFPCDGLPKLTVEMAARLQGFPDSWEFIGRKTAAYRQVGNAFPPPVAAAVGAAIRAALLGNTPVLVPDVPDLFASVG